MARRPCARNAHASSSPNRNTRAGNSSARSVTRSAGFQILLLHQSPLRLHPKSSNRLGQYQRLRHRLTRRPRCFISNVPVAIRHSNSRTSSPVEDSPAPNAGKNARSPRLRYLNQRSNRRQSRQPIQNRSTPFINLLLQRDPPKRRLTHRRNLPTNRRRCHRRPCSKKSLTVFSQRSQ